MMLNKAIIIFCVTLSFFNFIYAKDLLKHSELNWLTQEKFEEIQKIYQDNINKKVEKLQNQKLDKLQEEYILECYKIDVILDLLQDYDYSTQGINLAYYYAYKQYDNLLNKYYILSKKQLDKKEQSAFLQEQRAWIKMRNANEEYIDNHLVFVYTSNKGGTMYSNLASAAKLDFVKNRVDKLFKYYYNGINW
ncbi:DUF1311 domain-containing protein [Campylobacter peloridis]|uniref:DUF1311 domain-containing protein n=1 Tax=Campylobacter peloridis TaxID=488546 RepID=A0A5C7DYV3_9BACT|nr:lysozyme inhibitor LprI family protein [Campylobacter peloridis]TXE83158.1 DUF1311 domain-containing protein [Campylobacter peloridis]